jgi:hypothetical protein
MLDHRSAEGGCRRGFASVGLGLVRRAEGSLEWMGGSGAMILIYADAIIVIGAEDGRSG